MSPIAYLVRISKVTSAYYDTEVKLTRIIPAYRVINLTGSEEPPPVDSAYNGKQSFKIGDSRTKETKLKSVSFAGIVVKHLY